MPLFLFRIHSFETHLGRWDECLPADEKGRDGYEKDKKLRADAHGLGRGKAAAVVKAKEGSEERRRRKDVSAPVSRGRDRAQSHRKVMTLRRAEEGRKSVQSTGLL